MYIEMREEIEETEPDQRLLPASEQVWKIG